MSILNTNITKQPLRLIEVPLTKFEEEVIPHHQHVFEQHKTLVYKLISKRNEPLLRQELKSKKRVIKQLKDLMYELDTLRTQVEDPDLEKFDTKTLTFRKVILNLISGYTGLEKRSLARFPQAEEEEDSENLLKRSRHPFAGASQIQIHDNLDELKLRQRRQVLEDVENVRRDAEDLQEIFTNLNEMVADQGEDVDKVEEKIETARDNVRIGFKDVVKAHKLKTAVYPVTGAFLGTMLGGPVGLVAGFKIGGLAALGCAIAGYTGGTFVNKHHEARGGSPVGEPAPVGQNGDESNEKKDI